MEQSIVIAVIGDLINSKQIANRAAAQKQFEAALTEINERFSADIVSRFTITIGDECQGVLRPTPHLSYLLDLLQQLLHPFALRIGVGVGVLHTPIQPHLSIGADGPAFWRAREAINYVHDNVDYGTTSIRVTTGAAQTDQIVNALISLSDFVKAKWRPSQAAVLQMMLEKGVYEEHFDQHRIAAAMNLEESTFYKRLKSSGVKLYIRSRKAAVQHLLAATVTNGGEG